MGGAQTTRTAWRASKEYQVWKYVDRPSTDPRYRNAYQLWRNEYIKTHDVVCAPKKLYIKKGRKKVVKIKVVKQNHENSIQCGCGGWVNPKIKFNVARHKDSVRHIKWEEEKEEEKQKKEREVVCKFLW